jgi:hypothetical protein
MLSFSDFFQTSKAFERHFRGGANYGTRLQVSTGTQVAPTNNPPGEILILFGGILWVEHHRLNGDGDIFYRVQGNADGVLLTTCAGGHQDHLVKAIAETDLDLLALPQRAFERLLATSGQFRGLVFKANSKRMLILMRDAENAVFF